MAVMHYTNNISRTYSNSRCTIFLLSHYLRYEGGLIIIEIIIIIMTIILLPRPGTGTEVIQSSKGYPVPC